MRSILRDILIKRLRANAQQCTPREIGPVSCGCMLAQAQQASSWGVSVNDVGSVAGEGGKTSTSRKGHRRWNKGRVHRSGHAVLYASDPATARSLAAAEPDA
jgi:hypothetical protein